MAVGLTLRRIQGLFWNKLINQIGWMRLQSIEPQITWTLSKVTAGIGGQGDISMNCLAKNEQQRLGRGPWDVHRGHQNRTSSFGRK